MLFRNHSGTLTEIIYSNLSCVKINWMSGPNRSPALILQSRETLVPATARDASSQPKHCECTCGTDWPLRYFCVSAEFLWSLWSQVRPGGQIRLHLTAFGSQKETVHSYLIHSASLSVKPPCLLKQCLKW